MGRRANFRLTKAQLERADKIARRRLDTEGGRLQVLIGEERARFRKQNACQLAKSFKRRSTNRLKAPVKLHKSGSVWTVPGGLPGLGKKR